MSRALRRHHEKRIKLQVQTYYGGGHRNDPRRIGQLANSRKLCSCSMCGNPRRYFNEPTLREKRFTEELRLKAQIFTTSRGRIRSELWED